VHTLPFELECEGVHDRTAMKFLLLSAAKCNICGTEEFDNVSTKYTDGFSVVRAQLVRPRNW
jgi:hypothetical protein